MKVISLASTRSNAILLEAHCLNFYYNFISVFPDRRRRRCRRLDRRRRKDLHRQQGQEKEEPGGPCW